MWFSCMPTISSGRQNAGTSTLGYTTHDEPVEYVSGSGDTWLPNTRRYASACAGIGLPAWHVWPSSSLAAWNDCVGLRLAYMYASLPITCSCFAKLPSCAAAPLNATLAWTLRFESRPSTTSNGMPGLTSAALIHSVP